MENKLQLIHESSMRILKNTGMKIHHEGAKQILKANGIREKDGIFFFEEEEIMHWIKKAPSSFEFHARDPKYTVTIGGDNSVTAPAYGAPRICDVHGNSRDAVMADYIKFCKLFHSNPFYKVNGGWMAQPNDKPADHAPQLMHYANLLHSDKCLQTCSGSREQVETLVEMTQAVFGDLDHPYMLTIANSNSPLQLDINMADTIMVFGRHKQPVAITACVMAGATGPITLAGAIALGNAEVLATIALAQMMNPGTPVLYGMQSGNSDMATMSLANGSPESALCRRYGALMGKFYGLPCRGGGSYTDSRFLDPQCGYESMLSYSTTVLSKMNYIIFGAGIVDGTMAMSFEKLMIDFEINEIVSRLAQDIEVNADTLAEDVIHEIGCGGNYMMSAHTFKHCRKDTFIPLLSTRGNVPNSEKYFNNIQNRLESLLDSYEQPAMDDAIKQKLEDILRAHGIDPTLE